MARTLFLVLAGILAPTYLLAGCGEAPARVPGPSGARAAALAGAPSLGRPEDGFIGSGACERCHVDEHASWHRSYHRTMTQVASPESVLAPFDGQTLVNRGRAYRLEQSGDAFFVHVRHAEEPETAAQKQRIVMTTGSHHMQVYWMESAGKLREQVILPFVYLFEDQRWIPREDAFIYPPHQGPMPSTWNDGCIRCHSTGGQPGLDAASGHYDSRVAELGIACEACHGPGRDHAAYYDTPEADRGEAPARDVVQPLHLPEIRQAQICGQCHAVTGPPNRAADDAWLQHGRLEQLLQPRRQPRQLPRRAHRQLQLPDGDHRRAGPRYRQGQRPHRGHRAAVDQRELDGSRRGSAMIPPGEEPLVPPAEDPLVPPIPSTLRRAQKRRRGDHRSLLWVLALGLGVALGIACFRYVPAVKSYFAYWEARALS
jgi:hypothetical protein